MIEFNNLHGRVVDIDMFAATLVELARPVQRAKVEQAVFRKTWRAMSPAP